MSNTAKNTKYTLVTITGEETQFSSKKTAIANGEKSGVFFHVLSPAGTIVHEYAAPEDEDLLGDVEDEDLLGEVEVHDNTEEIDATEVTEGMLVVSARRGHPDVEVARVRVGRKHVTLFNAEGTHFVWVPVATGKVRVRTAE